MKKVFVWALTLLMLVAVAGCEKSCEKEKRPLNPTEKRWRAEHPGELMDGPEDFAKFAPMDRCDPRLEGVRWRRVYKDEPISTDPRDLSPAMRNNKPPEAVVIVQYEGGKLFSFDARDSKDKETHVDSFEWQVDYKVFSKEPTFFIELTPEDHVIILNITDSSKGDNEGNEFKTGSSIQFKLPAGKIICPED